MPHSSGNPTWEDYPSQATLVTAQSLENIEGALDSLEVSKADKSNLKLNAKTDFGAVGDGVADDTVALQTMITYLTTNGRTGVLPAGTYRITSPLNFSRRPGWRIEGEGAYNTTIRQDTDNVAVLNIGSDTASSCHSWGIVGVQLTYLNVQPSANAAAVAMQFSQEVNNGFVRDVIFARGAYGVRVVPGIGCPWGGSWDDLRFGNDVSISAVDEGSGTNAVPNNSWGRMLVTAASMVGPVFNLRGINTTIDTIEILQANLGPKLLQINSGGHFTIGAIKVENGTYAASQTLIDLQGAAKVKIGQFALYGTALNISGAATKVTAIGNGGGGTGGWADVDDISLVPTSLSGGAQLFAVSANNSAVMTIGYVDLQNGSTLLDQGSTATAETTTVRSQVGNKLSANIGDANLTIAQGGANKYSFQTAFTAPRTIDLPAVNNNLFNGLYYEFVFNGAVNTVNYATIRCNGTTLLTQSTDKVIVGFTYRRNPANPQGGWVLTRYEPLVPSPRDGALSQIMVLFGDSWEYFNYGDPATSRPSGGSRGYAVNGNIQLGKPFTFIQKGVGGQDTNALLARAATDLVAVTAGWALIGSGTNDITNGLTYNQIRNNLTSLYDMAQASGKRVVGRTIPPRTGATTAQQLLRAQVNAWLRDQAATRPGFVLVDVESALMDPTTNDWVSGWSIDGVHLSNMGAVQAGAAFARAFAQLVVPVPIVLPPAGSLNLLKNNGGSFPGAANTVPTGWTANGWTAGAPTYSKVARTDIPGNWQQLVVPSDSRGFLRSTVLQMSLGEFAVGDVVRAAVEFQADTMEVAPNANSQSIYIQLEYFDGTTTTYMSDPEWFTGEQENEGNRARSGVLATPWFTIPAGGSGQTLAMTIQARCGGTYRFGRASLIKQHP